MTKIRVNDDNYFTDHIISNVMRVRIEKQNSRGVYFVSSVYTGYKREIKITTYSAMVNLYSALEDVLIRKNFSNLNNMVKGRLVSILVGDRALIAKRAKFSVETIINLAGVFNLDINDIVPIETPRDKKIDATQIRKSKTIRGIEYGEMRIDSGFNSSFIISRVGCLRTLTVYELSVAKEIARVCNDILTLKTATATRSSFITQAYKLLGVKGAGVTDTGRSYCTSSLQRKIS